MLIRQKLRIWGPSNKNKFQVNNENSLKGFLEAGIIDTGKWGKSLLAKEFPFNQIKKRFSKFALAHCKNCE